MRAVRVHEHGGPEVLRVEELPTPEPGSGQVRVRVQTAGVNFYDIRVRTGDAPVGDLPVGVGQEGAGVVEALGADADELEVGDRVGWHWQPGSYATHTIVPVSGLVPLPPAIGTEVAAHEALATRTVTGKLLLAVP